MERAPRVKQSDPYGAGQNWLKDRCSEGGGIPSLIDTMPKAPYKDRGSSTQSSTRSVKGPYRVSKKQSPHPSSFSTMSNKTYNTSGGSTAGKYVSERAVDEYRGGSQYQVSHLLCVELTRVDQRLSDPRLQWSKVLPLGPATLVSAHHPPESEGTATRSGCSNLADDAAMGDRVGKKSTMERGCGLLYILAGKEVMQGRPYDG